MASRKRTFYSIRKIRTAFNKNKRNVWFSEKEWTCIKVTVYTFGGISDKTFSLPWDGDCHFPRGSPITPAHFSAIFSACEGREETGSRKQISGFSDKWQSISLSHTCCKSWLLKSPLTFPRLLKCGLSLLNPYNINDGGSFLN